MTLKARPGQRVGHRSRPAEQGVIESVERNTAQVRWDDGSISLHRTDSLYRRNGCPLLILIVAAPIVASTLLLR